jgi:hypothetical protein
LSVALGCDPLNDVMKICLVGHSPWQKIPRAITKTILPALIVATKPDAPLLAPSKNLTVWVNRAKVASLM